MRCSTFPVQRNRCRSTCLQRKSQEQALDDESRPASPEKGGQKLNARAALVSITHCSLYFPLLHVRRISPSLVLHPTSSFASGGKDVQSPGWRGSAAPNCRRWTSWPDCLQATGRRQNVACGHAYMVVFKISATVAGAWEVLLQLVLHSCFFYVNSNCSCIIIIIYYHLDNMVHI